MVAHPASTMSAVDIRQLQYVVRLAETLHFGKAAASVFISQPAFSVQISKLEKELNCTLFERTNNRVVPTEAGLRFVERAQVILNQVYAARYEAQRISDDRALLRVGFFGEGAAELADDIFREFMRRSPTTELHVVELMMTNQVPALVNNEVDVSFIRTPIVDSRLHLTPLFEEPRVAVVPTSSPLAIRSSLSVEDLLDQPFAIAGEGAPREWASFWSLDDDRGSPSRVGGDVKSIPESLATVAYCNAVDTYPASASRLFSHPGATYVPLSNAPLSELSVARLTSQSAPEVREFIQICVDVVLEKIGLIPGAVLPSDDV
jgi:DNA-binding transcriptional LysR family regulator